ncbi:signal peptide peptidase SppA [Thalassiella azotivora]
MRLPAPLAARLPGADSTPLLLELDLTRRLLEDPPVAPLDKLAARQATVLRRAVDALEHAAADERVAGVVAHVGTHQPTLAQSAELRAAVRAVRDAGKLTVCWSEAYGPELGAGNAGYHLATAFEQVWLLPSGGIGLVGVSASAVLLRDALDKLGVRTQIGQRHEYKTAADTFTQRELTEPHREMLASLAGSATDTLVSDVAAARGLDADAVRQALAAAPLTAPDALDRGLVDHLGYRDDVYAAVRERLGEVRLQYLDRYAAGAERARWGASLLHRHRPVVGVVQVSGPIHLGRSRPSTPLTGPSTGSDTVGAALRAAARDDDVEAVVLRVDSPGGSYVASDAIRDDVLRLRSLGKPVVASMANVAASGGYFVAMPADEVLASPGTVTGSIGVLAGKQVLRETLERVGVRVEGVSAAPHADMFSAQRPFDDEEWSRLEAWLDQVYADFTGKAAHDRGMAVDRLEPLARGRVWTGADAARHGLVDTLGGLSVAVDAACRRAGVRRPAARVRPMPHVGLVERLTPPENSESPAAVVRSAGDGSLLAGAVGGWGVEQLLARTGLAPHGALSLPVQVRLR